MWNNTRAGGRRSRRGYTLLELLLALALSSLVIYSILWAIQLHLRSLDVRRTSIEEAQLARAVMRMISDDLRRQADHFIDLVSLKDKVGRDPSDRPAPRRAPVVEDEYEDDDY